MYFEMYHKIQGTLRYTNYSFKLLFGLNYFEDKSI